MAKHHDPSSGKPYVNADDSMGEFVPKGEPETLNVEGVQVPKTEADEALAEFGPTKAGGKSSSIRAHGKVPVPLTNLGGEQPYEK